MTTHEESQDAGEDARPSSLISVHKLSRRDIHYDLQLRRGLEIANARTRAELGSLPPEGLPVVVKRKPNLPSPGGTCGDAMSDSGGSMPLPVVSETPMTYDLQEAESMKLQSLALAAAVGAAALVNGPVHGAGSKSTSVGAPTTTSPRVPEAFRTYSSTPVGDESSCVVGSVADEDGMYARPFVYLVKTEDRKVQWAEYLSMQDDDYEGRATHCLGFEGHIYVLLQVDTQGPRSLSQTLLSVIKLRLADGVVEKNTDVLVPDTHGNYSAWVKRRDGSFKRVNDELIVTGKYRYMDTEDELPFSAAVKP